MRISAFLENIDQAARETGTPLAELLTRLKQEGLESVYANLNWNRNDEIMPMLKSIGLTLEGLWDNIQMHAMTDAEADAEVAALVDSAARNGAKHVLITPGQFHGFEEGIRVTREEAAAREPEIRRMIEAMRRAKACGDSRGVAVTMENYDVFVSPIVFPEILRRFFEEIPGLQCSFDTGNFVPCDRDVMAEFAYYKDRIVAIHLKDRVENDTQDGRERQPYITESGRKFYPAVVGCGDMHVPEIIGEMRRAGYTGCGIIELYGSTEMTEKLIRSIRWLKANADRC